MKIKRILTFIVLCLSTLMLFGCGRNETQSNNELTIWWPSGKTIQKILSDAVERYKEKNPDIKINAVKKPGLDIYDAYKLALNDNNSRPDIAILDHVYVQALANEKLLANLSKYGSDEDVKSRVPETVYEANTYLGINYGLPLSANTVALMYNKDILSKAGVTDAPKTLEELLECCQKVEEAGYKAFAQPINQSFVAMEFASYVARVGGNLVSDDYQEVLINSELVRKAIDAWVSLSKYASQNEYEEGLFYNGKIAFIEMGSWNLTKVSGATALFDCGFSEMVTIDENITNYSGLGLYSLVISDKSNNKELAYDFAKFLCLDKQFQLEFAQEKDLLPVTNEALDDDYYKNDPVLSIFAKQLKKVAFRPGTAIWPTMEKQLVNMLYSCVKASSEEEIARAIALAQTNCQTETDRKYKK